MLQEYTKRYHPEKIIVASPAFYKEDLLKKIKDSELRKKIITATCSTVGENAVDEVLRRPELKQALQHNRAREEQLLVEELLSRIEKNTRVAYGKKAVQQAIDAGAVESLIITDSYLAKMKEEEKYEELDEQMKHVDNLKGSIHIVSTQHEGGQKVDGLGGIAALLRYDLSW